LAAWEDGTGRVGPAALPESSMRKTSMKATGKSTRKHPQGILRGDEIPNRTHSTARTQANEKATTVNSVRCTCGELCKNEHGLKPHMVRMKCRVREREEHPAPHKAQNLRVFHLPTFSTASQKRKMRLPKHKD